MRKSETHARRRHGGGLATSRSRHFFFSFALYKRPEKLLPPTEDGKGSPYRCAGVLLLRSSIESRSGAKLLLPGGMMIARDGEEESPVEVDGGRMR
jgi:hypothetical protein